MSDPPDRIELSKERKKVAKCQQIYTQSKAY